MQYEDALKAWGLIRLTDAGYKNVDPKTVNVSMDFSEGYACCGGTDPNCYCSFAESPRADVLITADRGEYYVARVTIRLDEFDFARILGEIVDAADGVVTNGAR